MKKVLFTSILLLSAVSFGGNIYAQDTAGGNNTEVTTPSATKPSVKFTATTKPSVKFTADGNTLTISGQGDLTSYTTTDLSAKVFTDKAVGFVFTDADGKKHRIYIIALIDDASHIPQLQKPKSSAGSVH